VAVTEGDGLNLVGVLDTLCDKVFSDLRQVDGFLRVASTNETGLYDISEILLKVVLNTTPHNQWLQ
jgi:hypothetical protein